MENQSKKLEENEKKNALLSAALFGGNPLMQVAGNKAMNSLFSSLSNNYNKVDYSSYYEITIKLTIKNKNLCIVLNTFKKTTV